MDGTETHRRNCAAQEPGVRDRMLEPSDGNAKAEERVTLKKEIGLMSACAIIIGEWMKPENNDSATLDRVEAQQVVEVHCWIWVKFVAFSLLPEHLFGSMVA